MPGRLMTDWGAAPGAVMSTVAWKEAIDPRSGNPYWYNADDTTQVTWNRPDQVISDPMACRDAVHRQPRLCSPPTPYPPSL